jgi:phosphohistidine phosphatase
MNLFLMRHTKPVHGHPLDGTRPLTDEGKAQAVDMAEWLRALIGRTDIVICSPMARSLQTAAVMAGTLGSHVADTKMLEPNQQPEDAWKEIERLAQQSKDVLIVGHDPSINTLLCWLQGNDLGDANGTACVRFGWGAIAYVRVVTEDPPSGILQWLVTPALVLKPEEKEVLEAARELSSVL